MNNRATRTVTISRANRRIAIRGWLLRPRNAVKIAVNTKAKIEPMATSVASWGIEAEYYGEASLHGGATECSGGTPTPPAADTASSTRAGRRSSDSPGATEPGIRRAAAAGSFDRRSDELPAHQSRAVHET